MMGGSSSSIHLRPQAAPHPPLIRQHAMSSGHGSSNRGKPSSTVRLRMGTGTGTGRRLRLVSSCCTAGGLSEPSPDPGPGPPEEDPRAARSRKYRDAMDKYAIEYARALEQLGLGTSQDSMLQELEATLFRDEDDKLGSYVRELSSNRWILDKIGRGVARMICIRVGMAIQLSIMVAANAHLRFNESSGLLSPLTVKQTIRTYVSTFLMTAEVACHRKVDSSTISLFLGALRGLAAISHILFEDALAALNHIEGGSSNYILEYDVERLNHELNFNMKELEKNFTTASESEVYELLRPTLTSAERHISRFVYSMMSLRRKMVLRIEARNRQ